MATSSSVLDQGRKFLEMFVFAKAVQPAQDAADAEGTTDATPEGADVSPFQKAKAEWERTRKNLNGQMKTLQSAILKRCAQMGITDIKGETDELFRQLGGLDQALEDALQTVIAAPEGDTRLASQKAAGKVADKMLKELNSPFFNAVDSGNGFRSVAVRADPINRKKQERILHLNGPDQGAGSLEGKQPAGLTSNWYKQHGLPIDWQAQRDLIATL